MGRKYIRVCSRDESKYLDCIINIILNEKKTEKKKTGKKTARVRTTRRIK